MDSDTARARTDTRCTRQTDVASSLSNFRNTEDMNNAGAFQLFLCKFDAALAENKKLILKKKIKAKTCFKRKREFFWLQLEHHKERYYFLTHIQTDYEKIEKPIDFGDIAKVKDVI